MNFQTVNPLNDQLNRLSGNLLPVTGDDSLFPVSWRIYSAFIWLIEVIQTSAVIPGVLSVPREKTLQDATVGIVVTIEVLFLLRQMHANRKIVVQLIRKLNDVMRTEDETMKIIIKSTLNPVQLPLKFYWLAGTGSLMTWCCMSFMLIFKKNCFLYEDYRIPIILSRQPFSINIFLLGNCVVSIASVYMFIKKVALDVYMINFVLLVTAQYRYIAVKLATIFQENVPRDQRNESEKERTAIDSSTILKMKALCQHHSTVIQITLMLKKLLSLNMSMIYLTYVFIFCFLNVMLISAVLSRSFMEGIMIIMYISGCLVELYILCLCVNQLLDASVEITDKVFHEKWYQFESPLKHMLRMMITSHNLECKLSVSERFNLSLPSFMTILNQAYSFALLFLKLK